MHSNRWLNGLASVVIIDIELALSGPWAGYPWVCLKSGEQSKMVWVSDLISGMTRFVIFDPVIWPEGAGSGSMRFIAAITDSEVTQVIGAVHELEFSWIE